MKWHTRQAALSLVNELVARSESSSSYWVDLHAQHNKVATARKLPLGQGSLTAIQGRGCAEVLGTTAQPATAVSRILVTILTRSMPDMFERPVEHHKS